jgi:Amt family ammonium transporter
MTTVDEAKIAINALWLLVSTAMIFLMQSGFALVECGSVRAKNSRNILIKNLFDACIGAIAFWCLGYGFAFGDVNGGFIGSDNKYFAASGFETKVSGKFVLEDDHYVLWMFQFSFAATAATIVSGSLAERT